MKLLRIDRCLVYTGLINRDFLTLGLREIHQPSLNVGQTLSHKAVLSTHQNAYGQILTNHSRERQ
jgi:hypothetical protein